MIKKTSLSESIIPISKVKILKIAIEVKIFEAEWRRVVIENRVQ